MQTLNVSEFCNRIALHPPYFAFSDLYHEHSQGVRGRFCAEHQTGYESGPVSAAELVRHLAALGTCAAVIEDSLTPTYYLGTKGRLKVLRNVPGDVGRGEFHAFSEVLSRDRKTLVAHSTVTRGQYLAHFSCEYQSLPAPVFSRTFKNYRTTPSTPPAGSPYREPIELDFEPAQATSLVAHSRPLPDSRFAGHFLEYPAWPASLYCETVSRVAGKLLHHMLEDEVQFSVARMDIDALRLISASQNVSFHLTCTSASKLLSRYVFRGEVRNADLLACVIEMEVYV
ncbi:hypothetical protein [Burkholderia ubonensis]|uniref:hypothetical protein n=1 Tax=Burkholderia ubonensis TaxID=101571 RepID=UPI000AFEDE21|nr:hypothetical protein [Burkholderia ubonensis]